MQNILILTKVTDFMYSINLCCDQFGGRLFWVTQTIWNATAMCSDEWETGGVIGVSEEFSEPWCSHTGCMEVLVTGVTSGTGKCWTEPASHTASSNHRELHTVQLFLKSSKQDRRLSWLNRKLCLEQGQKKKIYDLWEQCSQDIASQGQYRGTVSSAGRKWEKSKPNLSWQWPLWCQTTKMAFSSNINSKKRSKENIRMIFGVDCHLITKEEEKAEALIAFLPQYLTMVMDVGLPWPQHWRTATAGTETSHLWSLKLWGTSYIGSTFLSPQGQTWFIPGNWRN